MSVNITIRRVRDEVRDELAGRAERQGRSLQEFLNRELERLASRPDPSRWLSTVRRQKQLAGEGLTAEQILEARDADRR